MNFSIKYFSVNSPVDLVQFAETILNRKLYYLSSGFFGTSLLLYISHLVSGVHIQVKTLLTFVKKQFYGA